MSFFEIYRVAFLVFCGWFLIQRIQEARCHKKIPGITRYSWVTKGLIGAHVFFFLGSITEVTCRSSEAVQPLIVFFGVLIFGAAFALRRWVISTLGAYWSVEIEMRQDHPLIKNGPFRFVRHPNYVAIILEVVGFCLIAMAYKTLLISLIIYLPLLLVRIKYEENELAGMFGERYVEYMREVPMLIPRLLRKK